MGMAKLNIWVSAIDDPCGVDDRTWYITIFDCNGKVLEWCGKRYVVLPAKCGHLEVDVPPGCYYIKGVWSFRIGQGVIYVNHFTDAAIVQACCEKTVCVKLFNPSIHRCGTIFLRAVNDLVMQKAILPEAARLAENGVNAVLNNVPRPLRGFELDNMDEIEKKVKDIEAKNETGGKDEQKC